MDALYGIGVSSTDLGQGDAQSFLQGPFPSGVPGPFSLTQLLTALVIGLLTAFAFQVLMASLGAALALSLWGIQAANPEPQSLDASEDLEVSPDRGGWGGMVRGGLLLTVNGALFTASYLAARFAIGDRPAAGAIAGVVIWSAYLLLLLWISTRTVGSVIGGVLDMMTGGARQMVGAIAAAVDPPEEAPLTRTALVDLIRQEMPVPPDLADLEAVIDTQVQQRLLPAIAQLRQEMQAHTAAPAPDPARHPAWGQLASYLQDTDAKHLTPKRMERDLTTLLDGMEPLPTGEPRLDRDSLHHWLSQRGDLSSKKQERIVRQVEALWRDRVASSSPSAADSEHSSQGRSPSPTATEGLPAIAERVLDVWPDIMQHLKSTVPHWTELAPILVPMLLDKIQATVEADPAMASDAEGDDEPSPWQRVVQGLADASPGPWSDLAPTLVATATTLRDRSLHQVDAMQQAAQDQVEDLKHRAQHQADRTRRTAATAAWWLVLTAATGAGSAALAGAIACGLDLTPWVAAVGHGLAQMGRPLEHAVRAILRDRN